MNANRGNILFVLGDGIGNMLQCIPSFFSCRKKHPNCKIFVYNIIPTNKEATKVIFEKIADGILFKGKDYINPHQYLGQYTMYPTTNRIPGVRFLNQFIFKPHLMRNVSEVVCNMYVINKMVDEGCIDECHKVFKHIEQNNNVPDILIHNGYSKHNPVAIKRWKVKEYPYYPKLVAHFVEAGYSVGSIGSKNEYIEGTINLTGLSLEKTISVMKGAKLLISNDTSTYHLANVLRRKNIAIFTCTSNLKNYHPLFHKYTTIVRRKDLPCSPCQNNGKGEFFWIKNKNKCHWACREISTREIFSVAQKLLKET